MERKIKSAKHPKIRTKTKNRKKNIRKKRTNILNEKKKWEGKQNRKKIYIPGGKNYLAENEKENGLQNTKGNEPSATSTYQV